MTKVILVVPDPGRKKTQLQLQQQTYADWVLTPLPHQEADYLLDNEDLNGLIFVTQSHGKEVPEGHQMVYINEVLLMWHTIDVSSNNCLQARYMSFKTFVEIIQMRFDKLQSAMQNFAAVWGGLDLTKIDSEAPVLFRQSDSSRDQEDSTVCCTFERYVRLLRRLEAVLPVWPGVLECRVASYERNIINLLDSIARDITQTHRPKTQVVNSKTNLHLHYPERMVVKREGSASRRLIKYTSDRKQLDEAMKYGNGGHQLFMQPYVPEWDEVGQWRCLMVGMALFCIFIHPGSYTLADHNARVLAYGLREDGWTLNELGQLRKNNPDQCSFMIREGGTREEIARAQQEIEYFLVTTLAVFITGEEVSLSRLGLQETLQPSSLRVSARVDLSVITHPDSQQLHYFVTGISRGPGMMLYGSVSPHTIRRFALEFVRPFESWIGPRDPRPQPQPTSSI
ncbi:hypothetical protein BDR07DRAFT_1405696 [Suillus spraguei]|nr:hypothetical protein BDR07DRAFT_1405696 [Suillus spraguei]